MASSSSSSCDWHSGHKLGCISIEETYTCLRIVDVWKAIDIHIHFQVSQHGDVNSCIQAAASHQDQICRRYAMYFNQIYTEDGDEESVSMKMDAPRKTYGCTDELPLGAPEEPPIAIFHVRHLAQFEAFHWCAIINSDGVSLARGVMPGGGNTSFFMHSLVCGNADALPLYRDPSRSLDNRESNLMTFASPMTSPDISNRTLVMATQLSPPRTHMHMVTSPPFQRRNSASSCKGVKPYTVGNNRRRIPNMFSSGEEDGEGNMSRNNTPDIRPTRNRLTPPFHGIHTTFHAPDVLHI